MDKKIENMKFKVSESTPCEMIVDITVPVQAVKEETDLIYKKIQPLAQIPGFRQGKAPMDKVKQIYAHKAKQEIIDSLVNRAITQVLEEKEFKMISYPVLHDAQFDFEKDFQFKISIEQAPDYNPKNYMKMKLEKKEAVVSDEDIEKEIKYLQERSGALEPATEAAAEKTHYCVIDYSAEIGGSQVKELSAKGQLVSLNEKQFIPELADGIAGMKLSETKSIEVIFPADFTNKKYAGKKALFTVTLKELKNLKLPVLDDEFAKDLGCDTLQKLKETIKANLTSTLENEAKKEMIDQITKELLKDNTGAVPQSFVQHELSEMLENAKNMIKRKQNFSEKDWEDSVKALEDKYRPKAEEKVRLYFILSKIIEKEKIGVSEDEMNKQKESLKIYSKMQGKDFDNYYESKKSNIMAYLKEEKVFDLIIGNAKIKTKNK